MRLSKVESAALDLAHDTLDFFSRNQSEEVVAMRLDVLIEPFLLDNFNLNPQHRKDVFQHLAKVVVTMLMNVPVDEMIEEKEVFKFILGGHFLQVLKHLPLLETDDGKDGKAS